MNAKEKTIPRIVLKDHMVIKVAISIGFNFLLETTGCVREGIPAGVGSERRLELES